MYTVTATYGDETETWAFDYISDVVSVTEAYVSRGWNVSITHNR